MSTCTRESSGHAQIAYRPEDYGTRGFDASGDFGIGGVIQSFRPDPSSTSSPSSSLSYHTELPCKHLYRYFGPTILFVADLFYRKTVSLTLAPKLPFEAP